MMSTTYAKIEERKRTRGLAVLVTVATSLVKTRNILKPLGRLRKPL